MKRILRFFGFRTEYVCKVLGTPVHTPEGFTYSFKPIKKIYRAFGIKVYSTTKIDFS